MHFGAKFLLGFTMPSVNRGGAAAPPESATAYSTCVLTKMFTNFEKYNLQSLFLIWQKLLRMSTTGR